MATNLCDKVGSNTGDIKCDSRRGRPVIIAYGGKVFGPDEYDTEDHFKAAFKAAMILPTGDSDKLYAIPENVGINDQTAAPKTSTLGAYGPEVVLVAGRGAYEFDLVVGITLEKKLRELNGETVPFFIWDDKKNMWGADNGEDGFVGYDCIVSVIAKPFEDAKDARVTKFKISMVSDSQFADDGLYVPAKNMKGSDFKGLNDVQLKILSVSAGQSSFRVGMYIPTSMPGRGLDIFDDYKTSALSTPAAWQAEVEGVGIDVVAVSADEEAIDAVSGVPGTAPTGEITLTTLGSDGDTIYHSVGATALSATVAKTASETTLALLATKEADAITAASGTNGGWTAAAVGAVITITGTANMGDTYNGVTPSASTTGTVASTQAAISGGVDEIFATEALDAGKGFAISLDQDAVEDLEVGDIIEISTVDVTALQALLVKGIEITLPAEHTVTA